ncbi:hypothetical protein ABG79_00531 [Caloramator mitchellensis]|uniref:Uncharacterized protein n=1 Tax=Caloramator mitchellensis TaxID=908809 RepID=A0A0R3K2F1_CALMK|nr:hypothetical protein [Caloramator mitchellensis]KRQ87726.1 hypothetical protein ABG79_00531 [Caloramator mitchellensis]
MKKYFEMILVLIVTFMTLVAMYTLRPNYSQATLYTLDDEMHNYDDEAKFIFDNYYDVNLKFK